MIMRGVVILIFLGGFCLIPISAEGSTQDVENFRQVLLNLLVNIENSVGIAPKASSIILSSSDETFKAGYDLFPGKEDFLAAAKRINARIESAKLLAPPTQLAPEMVTPFAANAFQPNYPPDEGVYQFAILGPLRLLGLVQNPWDRCKVSSFVNDYNAVMFGLAEWAELADASCTVAGCDPLGLFCAMSCGTLAAAKNALWVARKPLDLCEFHDKNVKNAEIQAAYENGVSILNILEAQNADISSKLNSLTAQLSMHDTNIKAEFAAIKKQIEDIRAELSNKLDKAMILLNTPQGQREQFPAK